jgi:hypothetical protein
MLDNQDNNTTSLRNTPTDTVTKTPVNKKKPSLKLLLGGFILLLMVVGSGAALYLTQISQDVRQQASGCTYWNGQPATEGAIDNRGGIRQECKNGYWTTPTDGNTNPGGGSVVVTPPTTPPGTGGGTGGCVNGSCTAPPGGCVATHHCDELFIGGSGGLECTVTNPDLKQGGSTVDAQAEANRTCKCVQVDILSGGSNSCSNGHINEDWSTLIGAVIKCPDASANCGGTPPPTTPPTNPPTTPPTTPPTNPPTTPPSSSPSPSPINYFCNSDCVTDLQCKTAGNGLVCSDGKCRLESNPSSAECKPAIGPMCLDIDLVNSQNGTPLTEDPSFGDTIKFTCAEVADIDNYTFRVIEPDGAIVNLDSTGMTSEAYTITKDGKHFAQCQICTSEDDLSCLDYEAL